MKLQCLPFTCRWRCDRTRRFPGSTRFPQIGWLVGMIGAMSVVTQSLPLLPVVAAPTNAPTEAAPPAQPNATMQQLAGQWLTQAPLMGDMVIFVFAPDGEAFLISGEAPNGKALARRIRYRINTNAKPMQIDIELNRNTVVQTVFEFTPAGDLRLQMLNTAPGESRPTALTEDATLFQRISDDTTLPPNTLLINAPTGAGEKR